MKHLQVIVALFCLLITVDVNPGFSGALKAFPSEEVQSPQALWEVDLSKFGYNERLTEPFDKTYPHPVTWTARQSLSFTTESVIAATFETHIENSGPSVHGKSLPTDPYQMVALFLTAERGEAISKGDWPLNPSTRTSYFFPAQNGRFVLAMGNVLTLYSPDMKAIRERTVPASYGELLMAFASPDAETFLILYVGLAEDKYAWKLDLIDSSQLSVLKSWTGEDAKPKWSLWGNEIARFSEHGIQIESTSSGPKDVLTPTNKLCGYQSLVNQTTIAFSNLDKHGCNTVTLISTDGNTLQELHFEPNALVGAALASRNGKVFAIKRLRSQRPPWKPVATVFELGNDTPLLTVDFPEVKPDSPEFGVPTDGWNRMALSPDGDLLAVRSGPIVRVYRVPQTAQ
jgi:hypothetical protein